MWPPSALNSGVSSDRLYTRRTYDLQAHKNLISVEYTIKSLKKAFENIRSLRLQATTLHLPV